MGTAGFGGSFAPIVQYEKWEIHPVFPHFSYFRLCQNLAPNLLAPLCGVALTVSAVLKRQLQKDRAFPKKERLLSFFLWDMGLFPQWRADAKDTERMQEACIDTAYMQSGEVSDKKKNSADFTKNLHKNSQIVESCKLENIVIAFFAKSAIISA